MFVRFIGYQVSLLETSDLDNFSEDGTDGDLENKVFFEITVGARDQPQLLSNLSRALVWTLPNKAGFLYAVQSMHQHVYLRGEGLDFYHSAVFAVNICLIPWVHALFCRQMLD